MQTLSCCCLSEPVLPTDLYDLCEGVGGSLACDGGRLHRLGLYHRHHLAEVGDLPA